MYICEQLAAWEHISQVNHLKKLNMSNWKNCLCLELDLKKKDLLFYIRFLYKCHEFIYLKIWANIRHCMTMP